MSGKLTWFVTGCSSGMGECLVRAILVAVSATGFCFPIIQILLINSPLKEAGAAVMELDVTASAEVLNAKAKEAWEICGKIDVLVNNAAYIDAGVFEEIDEAFLTQALRSNAIGPLNITRAFLPFMQGRRTGTILFMSSVGAYYGAPGASAYAGSKGLLEGLVPSLGLKIEPFGLRTCMVTPGYFHTSVMTSGNILYRAPNPLLEYAETNMLIKAGCNAAARNQPGDPFEGATLIVDAVKGQGDVQTKNFPLCFH
ncbi:Short-chain dehydrogenase/reductase SDR [Penicillium fimorum]|uniref:Short-chain dehydrogenase/reductase SDR n=1 Tax=Penicillium fimorum TaxID=1882269 RepID=A0A9W9XSP7_9EURO|nr:Short-chain dehydrogenase/reductase SDR [Penicillium fimorum]